MRNILKKLNNKKCKSKAMQKQSQNEGYQKNKNKKRSTPSVPEQFASNQQQQQPKKVNRKIKTVTMTAKKET